jgi:MinD superfamily P-loop ATPase
MSGLMRIAIVSGKLVPLVRREAQALAGLEDLGLLIVTEPTLSGLHDMERVAALTRHFRTRAAVCINKFDINPHLSSKIERQARTLSLTVLGRVRYDPAVTRAQVHGHSVVEDGDSPPSRDIRALWECVRSEMARDTTEVMLT